MRYNLNNKKQKSIYQLVYVLLDIHWPLFPWFASYMYTGECIIVVMYLCESLFSNIYHNSHSVNNISNFTSMKHSNHGWSLCNIPSIQPLAPDSSYSHLVSGDLHRSIQMTTKAHISCY